jgi:hypothetical protein
MALSISWPTPFNGFDGLITIPKADTTLVLVGPPEVRSYDMNAFRGELGTIWASGIGGVYSQPFIHFQERLIAGYTYARGVTILPPYRVEFELGSYVVQIYGANHNILDVIDYNGVSIVTQNSAGLINVEQLNALTFQYGVHINSTGEAGTTYPIGTPQRPVNNLTDGVAIIGEKRLPKRIYFHSDFTLDSATPSLSTYEFVGDSPTRTTLTIDTVAVVTNCKFLQSTVTGVLDGGSTLHECYVDNLTYVDGELYQCLILQDSVIELSGIAIARILDCWCGGSTEANVPEIDLGGTGSELVVRGFDGCLKLTNKTGNEPISIDLNSGMVILDTTINAPGATCVVRGPGSVVNNATAINLIDYTFDNTKGTIG